MTAAWWLAALALHVQPVEPLYADANRSFSLRVATSEEGICVGEQLELSASSGHIEQTTRLSAGYYLVRWKPAARPSSELTLTAKVNGTSLETTVPVSAVRSAKLSTARKWYPLASTQRVEVRIDGPGDTPPRLATTVGRIGTPERTEDGWRAWLTPPAQKAPTVSIVSATWDGHLDVESAFTAVHWTARLSLPVDTEPNSKVTGSIGRRSSKPSTADANGRAVVEIEVHPTDTQLTLTGVDTVGNPTHSKVPVGVPKFVRRATVRRESAVAPDGQTVTRIDTFRMAGGVTSEYQAGEGKRIELVDVEITADPPMVRAGDTEGSRLSVRTVNADGVAVAGRVTIDVQGAQWVPDDDFASSHTGVVKAPARKLSAGDTVEVHARASGIAPCTLERALHLPLTAGIPAQVRLIGEPLETLLGSERALLAIEVTDEGGNVLSDVSVKAEAKALRAVEVERTSKGQYGVRLVAPDVRAPQEVSVRVVAGDAHSEFSMRVVPRPATTAVALRGVGMWNLGAMTTAGVEVEAQQSLPGVSRLAFIATASSGTSRISDGPATASLTMTGAGLGARWLLLGLDRRLQVAVSAGPQARFLRSHVVLPTQATNASVTAFGAGAHAEAGWRIGRGTIHLRSGYTWMAPSEGVVEGQLGGLELGAGYRFGF